MSNGKNKSFKFCHKKIHFKTVRKFYVVFISLRPFLQFVICDNTCFTLGRVPAKFKQREPFFNNKNWIIFWTHPKSDFTENCVVNMKKNYL